MTYEEVLKDWDYLWSISAADDMTGAYADQEDLDRMLRNLTKTMAKRFMVSQIDYWFQSGPDRHNEPRGYFELVQEYEELETIREKYDSHLGDW